MKIQTCFGSKKKLVIISQGFATTMAEKPIIELLQAFIKKHDECSVHEQNVFLNYI